jgi:hypothetical protein
MRLTAKARGRKILPQPIRSVGELGSVGSSVAVPHF